MSTEEPTTEGTCRHCGLPVIYREFDGEPDWAHLTEEGVTLWRCDAAKAWPSMWDPTSDSTFAEV